MLIQGYISSWRNHSTLVDMKCCNRSSPLGRRGVSMFELTVMSAWPVLSRCTGFKQ